VLIFMASMSVLLFRSMPCRLVALLQLAISLVSLAVAAGRSGLLVHRLVIASWSCCRGMKEAPTTRD